MTPIQQAIAILEEDALTNRIDRALEVMRGVPQSPGLPTPEQIEPILDDYLGVDCPHYEELRRRCAQRIFDLCVVMSGASVQSNNQISSPDTRPDRKSAE